VETTDGDTHLSWLEQSPREDPRIERLRLEETRPVVALLEYVRRCHAGNRDLVSAAEWLLKIADHLNALIIYVESPPEGPGAPIGGTNWNNLAIDAYRAKRAVLCLRAKRIQWFLQNGLVRAALDECHHLIGQLGKGLTEDS
jgi:hypothetical protein